MATNIKPFNSVGGYSVGPNLTPFLDANNNANVANLTVNGTFDMTGNIEVGNLTVNFDTQLNTLTVANAAVFESAANVDGILTVGGNIDAGANLAVTENANIGGTANVVGAATFGSTVGITGVLTTTTDANVGGNLNVTGSADIATDLTVDGNVTLNGANVDLVGTGWLTVANTANVGNLRTDNLLYANGQPWDLQEAAGSNTQIQYNNNGDFGASANFTFDSATNRLTVTGTANVTSNVDIGGALAITGGANVGGDLVVTGQTTLGALTTVTSGDLVVNDGLTTHGNVIMDADTGGFITIGDNTNGTNVSISGANVTLGQLSNLHILGGSNGQYIATDGSGNLTWTTLDTDTLANGTSKVSIDVANGPILFQVNGNANVIVVNEGSVDFEGNINTPGTVTGDTFFANTLANVYDLEVRNNANVAGDTILDGQLTVTGPANIANILLVLGAANINNTLSVTSTITGLADLQLTGLANIGGELTVAGAANIANTLAVAGETTIGVIGTEANLAVYGNVGVSQGLAVIGLANIGGNIDGGTNLNLLGDANIVGDTLIGGAANITGTANIVGVANLGNTLGVVGAVTFDSTLLVSDDANIDANLVVTGWANIAGDLVFVDANGTSLDLTSGLTTANLTANGAVDLGDIGNITIAGGANGQILSTDGAGNLSWTSTANINSIVNGTSNVSIPVADGNVYIGVNGQANIITVQSNGTYAITTITNDAIITGNLTVQGNVTNIDTTTLNVEDPVITEGRGPNNAPLTTNDGLDRGLYSYYYNGSEKGGFVGYKNAGAFAGSYVIATDATITDNVIGVNTYANVVVAGIISGAAGNTAGSPVSMIDMGTGSDIAFKVNGEADVLNITSTDITANANVAVSGNMGVTGGNITVTGGTSGAYGSQIDLVASPSVGPGVVTTIGSGTVAIASSTPTPIVTIADADGRTVEFFISARDTVGGNYEGAKYLVVSDGTGNVDWTSYGTVRMGAQSQQVAVTFSGDGTDLQARVAVLDNTTLTQFSTQYQIVG